MAKAFGRAITNAHSDYKLSGIMVAENVPKITHQQYEDDTILQGESIIEEALNLKSTIQQYMETSGQKVNAIKLEIFFINTKTDIEK